MEINSNVSLCNGELKDFVVQNSSTQPTTDKNGKVVYDTTNKAFYGYQGNKWKKFATDDDVPTKKTIQKYAKEITRDVPYVIPFLNDFTYDTTSFTNPAYTSTTTKVSFTKEDKTVVNIKLQVNDLFIDTAIAHRGKLYLCTGIGTNTKGTEVSKWEVASESYLTRIWIDKYNVLTHPTGIQAFAISALNIPENISIGDYVINDKSKILYKLLTDDAVASGQMLAEYVTTLGTEISYKTIINTLGYTPKDEASDIWISKANYAALTTVETDKVYYITEV